MGGSGWCTRTSFYALAQTSEAGTLLPEPERERLLTQACAPVCGLLNDWLRCACWKHLGPDSDGSVAALAPDRERFNVYLGASVMDALARAEREGMAVPPSLVDKARTEVTSTAGGTPTCG